MAASEARGKADVICDAGPLIHLAELDAIDLLAGFASIRVPEAVWLEVERHRPDALQQPSVELQRSAPMDVGSSLLDPVVKTLALDAGEAQALRLCLERAQPAILLTDDLAARAAAVALRVECHGTIGLVVRGIRIGAKTRQQVVALLESIPDKSTLHVRPSLLAAVIDKVKAAKIE